MQRIAIFIFSLFSSFILASDADEIRKARLEQTQAMAEGDVDRAVSFWTDDISLRRGLGSFIFGKDAYRALLTPNPDEKSIIYVRETDSIEVSGDWPLAYETGIWTSRIGSVTGHPLISGRYSAQWVKIDGKWLIRSELYVALKNMDHSREWPVPN